MERLNKNFIWMAAANIVSGLFNIVIFVYLARVLAPRGFGYLSYVQTCVFYLSNFVDLGLSTYGIREIAKDKKQVSEYVSDIVSFRFFIAAFTFLLFNIATFLSPNPVPLKILMAEFSLILFVSALGTEWAFQGIEKMHMVFISFAATSILQIGLIYGLVKGSADLLRIPIVYLAATLPIIAIFLTRLGFRLKIRNLDLKKIRFYLSSSLVIWSISIFTQIYNGLDIVILGLFRNAEEVGYFTIARKAVAGIAFLMVFLANAALPRLASTFSNDMAQFRLATRKFLKLAVILSLAVFLPIIFFSKEIISITFGSEYCPASLPLNIMILALILIVFNLPFSTGLIAGCFEKDVLKQVAFCAFFSLVLNFILMPKYGMTGAAVSFLITETVAIIWIIYIYRKRVASKLI